MSPTAKKSLAYAITHVNLDLKLKHSVLGTDKRLWQFSFKCAGAEKQGFEKFSYDVEEFQNIVTKPLGPIAGVCGWVGGGAS